MSGTLSFHSAELRGGRDRLAIKGRLGSGQEFGEFTPGVFQMILILRPKAATVPVDLNGNSNAFCQEIVGEMSGRFLVLDDSQVPHDVGPFVGSTHKRFEESMQDIQCTN